MHAKIQLPQDLIKYVQSLIKSWTNFAFIVFIKYTRFENILYHCITVIKNLVNPSEIGQYPCNPTNLSMETNICKSNKSIIKYFLFEIPIMVAKLVV